MEMKIKKGDMVLADVKGVPNTPCTIEEVCPGGTAKVFVQNDGDGFFTYIRTGTIRAAEDDSVNNPPKAKKGRPKKQAK